MTELLYLKDCYLQEFEANVVSAKGKAVELDRTAFYPEGGGQLTDTGKLTSHGQEYTVTSVKKDGGKILHFLDMEGLKEGDSVRGMIHWSRRHCLMRYHTACHVLARVIYDSTGAEISGSQIGLEKSRVDFTLKDFDRNQIKEFEKKANEIIARGLPVEMRILPREEAFKIPDLIRTKVNLIPESVKEIRVVRIEGLDEQACAGAHVKNTSEIGGIEVVGAENKGKENRRIYFRLAGGIP